MIKLTRITSRKPDLLTKQFHYVGGELKKISGGNMIRGEAELIELEGLHDFAEILTALESNQALAYGVCGSDKTSIATNGSQSVKQGRAVARTREFFSFPNESGVMMLDYDPEKGQPALSRDDLLAALYEVVPGLANSAHCWYTSSSSHIFDTATNADLTGLRGQRVYLLVKDAADIPRAGAALITKLWAAGHGFFAISGAGSLLSRTLVDGSVWQPERLDFAAGAFCGEGLEQRRGYPVTFDGELLDTLQALPDNKSTNKKAAESQEKARNAKAAEAERAKMAWIERRVLTQEGEEASQERKERARRQLQRTLEHSVLSGDFVVTIIQGGQRVEITVNELLDCPEKYHLTRTLDPLEPWQNNSHVCGVLYLKQNKPILCSQAHGGCNYTLTGDQWPGGFAEFPASSVSDRADAKRFHENYGRNWCYMVGKGWHEWRGNHWALNELGARNVAGNVGLIVKNEADALRDELADLGYSDLVDAKNCGLPDIEKKASAALKLYDHIFKCENDRGISATLGVAAGFLSVDALDEQANLLPCQNGVIDLTTGNLLPHRRENFNTICTNVSYDPGAKSELWERFISGTFGGDSSLIEYVQRFIGYCLTGSVEEHIAVIGWGGGRNGKSTLLEVITYILGEYAKPAPPGLLLSRNTDRHPTEIASLHGARFIAVSETGAGKVFDEERLKQMTGGDKLTARFNRGDFFSFSPTHKFFLVTNHKPVVKGDDLGIWRRIHLLPFEHTVKPEDMDTQLLEKLKADAGGVLSWMVAGAVKWRSDGLQVPEKIMAATQEYQSEMDVVGRFIGEFCAVDSTAAVSVTSFYESYIQWAQEVGEWEPTKQQFKKRMEDKGFRQKRTSQCMVWEGIGFIGHKTGSDARMPRVALVQ